MQISTVVRRENTSSYCQPCLDIVFLLSVYLCDFSFGLVLSIGLNWIYLFVTGDSTLGGLSTAGCCRAPHTRGLEVHLG